MDVLKSKNRAIHGEINTPGWSAFSLDEPEVREAFNRWVKAWVDLHYLLEERLMRRADQP